MNYNNKKKDHVLTFGFRGREPKETANCIFSFLKLPFSELLLCHFWQLYFAV